MATNYISDRLPIYIKKLSGIMKEEVRIERLHASLDDGFLNQLVEVAKLYYMLLPIIINFCIDKLHNPILIAFINSVTLILNVSVVLYITIRGCV